MIHTLLRKCIDRYPTKTEISQVEEYVATVPKRIAALQELKAAQDKIIQDMFAEYQKLYPKFHTFRPYAWAKAMRDVGMTMALCANAMFIGETDILDETWTIWFRSIMKSVHMTPQFLRDNYALMDKHMRRHISPEAYGLIKPYLDHIADVMCAIPEPIRPEVGERRPVGATR